MPEWVLDFGEEVCDDCEDDEETEKFFEFLRDLPLQDESKTSVVVPENMQRILSAYKILNELAEGTDINIRSRLYKPLHSLGFIDLSGQAMYFTDTEKLAAAAELSDNFEVFAKTNGTVEMEFTFHGLTRDID